VITDGFISGEKGVFDIINKNLGKTSFCSFGIGTSVNRYLIEGIAGAGMGEPFVATDAFEAVAAAERFRKYIESPVLTDINVSFEGFKVSDIAPNSLPTLFADRPVVFFGKWSGERTGTIKLTGNSGGQKHVWEIPVSESEPSEANAAIKYLWARTKVDMLTGYGFINDNDSEDVGYAVLGIFGVENPVKKEVTEIGLKYSMMTRYTSFVTVIDIIRNTENQSKDVDQPLPLPLHVSNLAVGGAYRIGSEPEFVFLAVAALAALLAVLLAKYLRRKGWNELEDD
jgi:Ca-activated chloride channel family protein